MEPKKRVKDTYAKPSSSLKYKTGFNADSQALNTGQLQSQTAKDSQYNPQQQSQSGQRGVQDLQKSLLANTQAQTRRAMDAHNSQKQMADQATRSQLAQQGLANQAQIYADVNRRAENQIDLAAKIQNAEIQRKFAWKQFVAGLYR